MLSAVVGHSEETDAHAVAEEVLEQCQAKLGRAPARAGLLFAAIDLDHQVILEAIARRHPGIALIGCTTDGEISSELGFREDSASLILFASDTVDFTTGVGRGLRRDVVGACRAAVEESKGKTRKEPRLAVAAPEGLTADGQSITDTLQAEFGLDVPIVGALAGDQELKSTRQFVGTEVLQDSVPVLLFSGDFQFSYGVATGWHQVGEAGRVTRASGAVVHEIDGAPAIEFYRKYLGISIKPAVELPLGVLNGNGEIDYLRASWGEVDEATGAVTFLAAVPTDARVCLTLADRDAILNGCHQSLTMAKSNLPAGAQPTAAVVFSCMARKILLGTRTVEELDQIRNTLGDAVAVCGFYGYGEISPRMGEGTGAKYHNESFVTLLLAE